jgi:serine/threonine protein kinase/WD40 repeat protein
MGEPTSESDVFNELAYEFAERYRRGERPSLTEYTDRHPELADEIRDLFPALVMVEQFGSGADRASDRVTGRFQPGRLIPERLGDFRIIREIGRGGMGIVYEAEQESLGRHVALKVLSHARHLGPIQLIRFQREARAAALLHHTNIVPVFGVGVHEDVHYYAMQFIQGQSLDSVLREMIRLRWEAVHEKSIPCVEPNNLSTRMATGLLRDRFPAEPALTDASTFVPPPAARSGASSGGSAPTDEAVSLPMDSPSSSSSILRHKEAHFFRSVARLGMQAAEALAYAHSHGVVHRDIKPANLLLDLQGTIWVTDFGLAKAEGHEELTSPGDVVGTLRYMAPERFQGKAYPLSDIYSLGLTLYELLTLKPAFTSSHRAQLIHSIINVEPLRPRKLEPLIPRDLETIILKATAKNPSDRFSTASEMARELGRFVEGRPIHSRRASVPERLWRLARRHPAVALLSLLAATLTTVLAIGSTAAAWKFREQRDALQKEHQRTNVELGRSLLRQVRALRYSRQPGPRGARLETLAAAARAAHSGEIAPGLLSDLRDEAISTLAEVDHRPVHTWTSLNFNSIDSSYAFDADRYVVVEGGRTVHLHRISDRSEIRVVKPGHDPPLKWPMLVPGGRFVILWSGSSRTELWDLERGEVPVGWPADVRCASYRADGKQVTALRSDGEVRIYDLPAMKEVRRCQLGLQVSGRFGRQQMALSPDGRYLAVMFDSKPIARVYDLARDRLLLEVKIPVARFQGGLSLSRHGRLLAVVHDRAISVYGVSDGELLVMLEGHQSAGINAWFDPEGDLLASECWDGFTRVWDPMRGRLLASLEGGFRGWIGSRSQLVVGLKNDLILHQITLAEERRTIDCRMLTENATDLLFGPSKLAFSPDGRMIAIALKAVGVRIVRASDGVGLARLPIGECDQVLFLSDGSLMTANGLGLCRWPVQTVSNNALRIGPPTPLAQISPFGDQLELASSASGRLVGFGSLRERCYLLLSPEQPWRRSWLCSYKNIVGLAISPDGRWAATTDWEAHPEQMSLKVWETATGQLKADYPARNSFVAFSPDGRWLGVNGSSGVRFLRTGSWTEGSRSDGDPPRGWVRVVFHPSSLVAAIIDTGRSVVHLVQVETGRRIASFEGSDDFSHTYAAFSPDGRFLLTAHADQKVNLWNLSSIRRRLEELELATGIPDLFDVVPTEENPPRIDRIEVEGADPTELRVLMVWRTLRETGFAIRSLLDASLTDPEELSRRGVVWNRLGHWQLAATDYRASLAQRPNSAITANELAWCLAARPGRGDAHEAVRWARSALGLEPSSTRFRSTLGAALYRAGQFAEAAAELERNIAQNTEMTGYDWVFLAMCKQRLGLAAQARLALRQAARWSSERSQAFPDEVEAFRPFLQEAHAVLDGSLPDLPSNVFDR